jgi:tripartite-type tricarboxylate transporter receptor subunit TctC
MRRPTLLSLALLTFLAGPATAQNWPPHPLRLIVPFPAGGSADVQSRLIAEALAAVVGEPVVVDNRPGAGGNIAAAEAARAEPDGTTLFLATTGTHATDASLYKDPGFDPVKDFAPLTLVTFNPQVIVAAPHYGNLSLEGLVARLKGDGGASFGSSGIGSATHIAGELFNRVAGTDLVHVPYRGQGPALTDLIAGRIDVMFPLIADVFPFLQSGQLRAVAVMSGRRTASLADVPTTAEAGYPKLVLSPIWTALYTTAGTPRPVIDRLNRELIRIISTRAFVERLEAAGYEIHASTPEQLGTFAAAETVRWGALVKSLNIRLE